MDAETELIKSKIAQFDRNVLMDGEKAMNGDSESHADVTTIE